MCHKLSKHQWLLFVFYYYYYYYYYYYCYYYYYYYYYCNLVVTRGSSLYTSTYKTNKNKYT
jgi:hypothetical protein